MILGIGSDLIDIRRIEKSLERHGERFVARIFTEVEKARAENRAGRVASYAKRFAAKEACSKALGAAAKLEQLVPPDHRAVIHLTITDEFPMAQAFVIIEALPYR